VGGLHVVGVGGLVEQSGLVGFVHFGEAVAEFAEVGFVGGVAADGFEEELDHGFVVVEVDGFGGEEFGFSSGGGVVVAEVGFDVHVVVVAEGEAESGGVEAEGGEGGGVAHAGVHEFA